MAAKELLFNTDARSKLKRGVDHLLGKLTCKIRGNTVVPAADVSKKVKTVTAG